MRRENSLSISDIYSHALSHRKVFTSIRYSDSFYGRSAQTI